ncbi:MAG TPA: L-lactate permease [Anaerolineaceae bacterium]|nr:L-lactate permease [Anaerolineaceae bacterium]HPN53584.1 L-lactate permease [Anaerolineaceae bacterium]
MNYFLAFLPILAVLVAILFFRQSGQRAGLGGWAGGVIIALIFFGLNWDTFWVSQLKGLYLSFVVLLILWPALWLYNLVDESGGIRLMASGLSQFIKEKPLLLLALAWSFSGLLEGLAGFGIPVAIVAPMLMALGVPPVIAVAAVAVGHAWSITFGDMGVIFQTLLNLTQLDQAALIPITALLLGAAALICGIGAAHLLGILKRTWLYLLVTSLLISLVQFGIAAAGLYSLAAFGAGLAGVITAVIFSRFSTTEPGPSAPTPRALKAAVMVYTGLAALMILTNVIPFLKSILSEVKLTLSLPPVTGAAGFSTAANAQVFRPMLHPGTIIFIVALLTALAFQKAGLLENGKWRGTLQKTWKMGLPTSLGILGMVGLSSVMDYCGMTLLLAQGLSTLMGQLFPLVSPLVGILGAFATGSNNNSNVLFASLQMQTALLTGVSPFLLVAAQTAGGSLGSMVAPAKIIVGCATAQIKGREGDVLRLTLPYGLFAGLLLGLMTLVISAVAG